jgi:hypothetical protein
LDKYFFGPLRNYLKNADAAWTKKNPQTTTTLYYLARLIGFAWNKAASMGVDVSAVESTGIYALKGNRVPEYFFCISDTRETVTFMATTPPDIAPICAPSSSGTNSQNVLPI